MDTEAGSVTTSARERWWSSFTNVQEIGIGL